jgi:hypothetical protein
VKRIISVCVALGLVMPAAAVASRVATGSTRTAVIRAAGSFFTRIPRRCLTVEVTTKDGGNWATVSFNAANIRSCERSAFNSVAIVHRAHRRWHDVGAGSLIYCGRLGIPVAVRHDLTMPCFNS